MLTSITLENIFAFNDRICLTFDAGKEQLNKSSLIFAKALHKKFNFERN